MVTVAHSRGNDRAGCSAGANEPVGQEGRSGRATHYRGQVVANPEKFKAPINVTGQVAKLGGSVGLFALSCEDACFSMPVKFSGTPPKPGSNVIVHGQLAKESNGRYVFNADSVMPTK